MSNNIPGQKKSGFGGLLKRSHISSKKAGLPPGTPVYTGSKKVDTVTIRIIEYGKNFYEHRLVDKIGECAPYLKSKSVTWINITGLHEAPLIEELGNIAGFHPLIIEDILNPQQRPKMESFDDYIFIVLKNNLIHEESGELEFEQISIILGKNFVISFLEKGDDIFDDVINRITNNKGRIRKSGADYLAYRLIDMVIDNYFKLLENIGDMMENIENELVDNPSKSTLHKIHHIKRDLIYVRKSIWPIRELINGLERDETQIIKKPTRPFLRDLYDHSIQIIDTVETFRDLISGMFDVYLSSISNRMNEIMKVLTIFTAIFIPMTLIAGIYGMNFKTEASPYNMPELGWLYGYPFSLGLMLSVAVTLLILFKKKKWY